MIMSTSRITRAVAASLALAAIACSSASDSIGPDERPESQLKLLRVASDAPPLATSTVSFYAVRGKNAEAVIWYRPRAGQRDSTKFLQFRLGGASLDRRPDGSIIADGDSVRITVTVTDPIRLIVQFQPSGLRFSAKDPARLEMFFGAVGADLDDDGKVDGSDDVIAQQLSIWRQEAPGQPWFKLASAVLKDAREVEADLSGFTGYALAY